MVENKVVVITGSASGIGFELGKSYAENGSKVVLTDLNAEGVEKAAEELKVLAMKRSA